MQILVDFENGDIYINRYLLDAMYWIRLIDFQWYWLLTWLPICGTKQNCKKKTDKNIAVGWNVWLVYMNIIYIIDVFCPGRTWVQKGVGTNFTLWSSVGKELSLGFSLVLFLF